MSNLRIPHGWRTAPLRVLVSYAIPPELRKTIPSLLITKDREVRFTTTRGAKLFSIEAKNAGATEWTRVSTVAAPVRPKSIRVALPSSFIRGTQVRVVAVTGNGKSLTGLNVPLPPHLRAGVSSFAARFEAVSELPLRVADASLFASASGDSKFALATPEESDIWKIRGKKIYFFNRLRGLQVIDTDLVKSPGQEIVSLPLAGAGEEMYLLRGDEASADAAILITTLPWSSNASHSTRLNLVDLAGDAPLPDTSYDLPGHYIESRLVGSLLHVVTSSKSLSSGQKFCRTHVTTIDVSQNGALIASQSVELEAEARVVGSTEKYLWIAANEEGDWWRHRLLVFPYKSDGSLGEPLSTDVGGVVQDKFKVGDTVDGLAVVTMNMDSWQRLTLVETFREKDGTFVRAAEPLELVRDESLFASRFDGDRLYVVTFEQVDPLWIVDLADPSNPQVHGHLEVPGWSNYIQPFGNVLLAVGRDGGKVQVSLFDVTDPAQPVREDVVDLGTANGWSWTEAEWNEKAVKILPEAGLILVPLVEWSNGVQSNCVALVDFDLETRSLTLQGKIDHDFAPRRASLMDESVIASVSNRELLLVDASNRAEPVVTRKLPLAFGVDKAVVHGDSLITFESGREFWSGTPRRAVLRTMPTAHPEHVLEEFTLTCSEVATAGIFGGRLVVIERFSPAISVWSLENPTSPILMGRTPLPFEPDKDTEILPVEGGRLAVVSRSRGWGHWIRPLPMPVAVDGILAADAARMSLPSIGWGNQGLHVAVADISAAPLILGTWQLEGDGYSEISRVYSAHDLLVFSFNQRDALSSASGYAPLWRDVWGGWSTRSWLQVLDLAKPSAPMAWAPVELPGPLVGISWMQRAGGVVFARTSGSVAALGFDGEFASLAAEVPVQGVIASQGSTVYDAADGAVKEWTFFEETSTWQESAGWSVDPNQPIRSLQVADGALLGESDGLAWVLGEDGSVQSATLPYSADLKSAAQDGSTFIVPAGEYGTLRIP